MLVTRKKTGQLEAMKEIFTDLAENLGQMGLTLHIWDSHGNQVESFEGSSSFCSYMHKACKGCHEEQMGDLVNRVVAKDEGRKCQTKCGCCLVCVPINWRRRLIGVAAACYPPREILDEEFLARLCDRLELDREIGEKMIRSSCRHSAKEAGDFLKLLESLVKHHMEAYVASDELKSLSDNLANTYEELSLLYRISGSMWVTHEPREFLGNICQELMEVMNVTAVSGIVFSDPPAIQDDIIEVAGEMPLDRDQLLDLAKNQLAVRFAKSNRAVVENEFAHSKESKIQSAVSKLVAVPLATDQNTIGMLIGFDKVEGEFDSVDQKLISSIGNQASIFLANNKLYAELQDLLMGVLHALTASIDAKDEYTSGHSERVAIISKRLAQACGFSPAKVQQIYLSGLLHDIGKIGVPEMVLQKTGRLTDDEFEVIKRHPSIGANILEGIRQLDPIISGIVAHHERPDGKGYPKGLKQGEIPIEGLIIGLADAFDAMTSNRTYRDALPIETVLDEIRTYSGTQFDPDLVDKFLSFDFENFMEELREPAQRVFPSSVTQENK